VALHILEINISIFLGFTDLKYFGFTEEYISVTVLLWFYVIIFHTKNKEFITVNLEFTRKRKKSFG